MRVISGYLKGRRLVSFDAPNIRPTTDRVKETLFNKLIGRVDGARVLDLFSGTGSLAIECVSRGAVHVDLVESHRRSLSIIRENLKALGIADGFTIHPVDVFKFIRDFTGEPFDLVIADPPFTQKLAHDLAGRLGQSNLIASGGWLVLETSSNERLDEAYPGLTRLDRREFGDKHLNFFAR